MKQIEFCDVRCNEIELKGYGIVKKGVPFKVSDKDFVRLIKQKSIWRVPKAKIKTIVKPKPVVIPDKKIVKEKPKGIL